MIFFISHILRKHGFLNTIVIDVEDTHVVALSAYAAGQYDPKLGIQKEKNTFVSFSVCSADLASISVRIHVLTGEDTTSEQERRLSLRMYLKTSMKPKNYWKISASL